MAILIAVFCCTLGPVDICMHIYIDFCMFVSPQTNIYIYMCICTSPIFNEVYTEYIYTFSGCLTMISGVDEPSGSMSDGA